MVPIVVVMVVGVIAFGLLLGGSDRAARVSGGSTLASGLSVDQIALVPGEPDEPTEVLAFVEGRGADFSQKSLARVRLDGSEGDDDIVWRSEPTETTFDTSLVRISGDRVYSGSKDRIELRSLETGDLEWTAELPDRLGPNCVGCMELLGDALMVRSYDGTLSRFDPDSPEPTWTHRLERTEAPLIIAGDQTVVIDTPAGAGAAAVQSLDPDTGKVALSTPLSCASDDDMPAYGFDPIFALPGSDDLVALLGTDRGCVVRIDPAAGTSVWTTPLASRFDPAAGDQVVVDERHLVVAQGTELTAVDLDSGTTTALEQLPDLRVTPNRIVDGHLIAETTTQRGTPRLGLASFDLATGRADWSNETGIDRANADELVDPRRVKLNQLDPATQRVLLAQAGDELLALTFDDSEATLDIRTLDPTDGGLGNATTRTYADESQLGDTPEVLIVADTRVLLTADRSLRLVSVPSGEIDSWPGE